MGSQNPTSTFPLKLSSPKMSACVYCCASSQSIKPSLTMSVCLSSQSLIKRSIHSSYSILHPLLSKLQISKPPIFSSQFSSLTSLTRRGLTSIRPKMDSNLEFRMFSQQITLDHCGPGNNEMKMKRDLRWMELKRDCILAKITFDKLKDRAFIYSSVLLITHGVIVGLTATKVLGMRVMVGGNAGLFKLILNKLPITLEFILTTMSSAYVAALLNYSSAQYELKEAEEKLRFAEAVLNNYEDESRGMHADSSHEF